MDHFQYRDGSLWCEEIPARDLAEQVGTPLYVYSRATLLEHYDRLHTAFRGADPLICYSIKSCQNLAVCRTLVERGAGMDVVSGGELERAWLAGCDMQKVVYAGVGKTDPEIRAALDGRHSPFAGGRSPDGRRPEDRGAIGWFNIESEEEFENISRIAAEMGAGARAALRVNPDVDPKTHRYTSTGKKETKFGVDLERALHFFETYGRDRRIALDALHIHLGSPIYDPGVYVEGVKRVLGLIDELASRGDRINTIDIGGGFGADYETDRSPIAIQYAGAILPLLRDRIDGGLRIILEPGRMISANAGVLLTEVQYVKTSGERRFAICDAGMHTLLRPALYEAFHFIWPAEPGPHMAPPRRTQVVDLPGLVETDVVGPICESADFLAKGRMLPPARRGDLLTVFAAGAYGMVMASNYNTHTLPAEVLVDGAAATLVRPRQTVPELLASEIAALTELAPAPTGGQPA
jgi:diaminopimelate decarboxylase